MRQASIWTFTRNEQLKLLVAAGHSATEIAATMQSTPEAVKAQRRRLGLNAKPARNPLTYRIAALVRMIDAETYGPRKTALRRRLLGTLADKHGLRREAGR